MYPRELIWRDPPIGLEAVLVIDDTTLGPAVGGTRTKRYGTFGAAVADARALARAMTIKCALAGLDAGGCKIVVRDAPGMDRARVFEQLGRRLAELDDVIRTAGDLGTSPTDLERMARHTGAVHLDGENLAAATARGLARCVAACAARRGRAVASLRVAVQGCGAIGASVADALSRAGARLVVADLDAARARAVAERVGAEIGSADDILREEVDVIAPCATGGVVDEALASSLRAWAVVGAANNVVRGERVPAILRDRDILLVPDVVASAGAVVDGIGKLVMKLDDRSHLIDALGDVAARVLDRAAAEGLTTVDAAERIAAERLGRRLRLFVT